MPLIAKQDLYKEVPVNEDAIDDVSVAISSGLSWWSPGKLETVNFDASRIMSELSPSKLKREDLQKRVKSYF